LLDLGQDVSSPDYRNNVKVGGEVVGEVWDQLLEWKNARRDVSLP
jgi:hypothetical protein